MSVQKEHILLDNLYRCMEKAARYLFLYWIISIFLGLILLEVFLDETEKNDTYAIPLVGIQAPPFISFTLACAGFIAIPSLCRSALKNVKVILTELESCINDDVMNAVYMHPSIFFTLSISSVRFLVLLPWLVIIGIICGFSVSANLDYRFILVPFLAYSIAPIQLLIELWKPLKKRKEE